MKVRFHGVRGGFFRPTRRYLFQNLIGTTITDKRNTILIDAGSNIIFEDELKEVKSILLTHTHMDHILHLGSIIKKIGKRPKIYAPQRLPQRLKLQSRNFDFSSKVPDIVDSFKVEFLKTQHAKPCYSYKISKKGKTVCFTGDTRYFPELAEFCKGADVLVCESTLSDRNKLRAYIRGHMRPGTVIRLAKEAKPKLLVLSHFNKLPPEEFLMQVKEGFPNTICAYEGMEIDV